MDGRDRANLCNTANLKAACLKCVCSTLMVMVQYQASNPNCNQIDFGGLILCVCVNAVRKVLRAVMNRTTLSCDSAVPVVCQVRLNNIVWRT